MVLMLVFCLKRIQQTGLCWNKEVRYFLITSNNNNLNNEWTNRNSEWKIKACWWIIVIIRIIIAITSFIGQLKRVIWGHISMTKEKGWWCDNWGNVEYLICFYLEIMSTRLCGGT